MFAAGAKLRRVGPMTTASGAYCIVELSLSLRGRGWGEVFAVAGARDAAVVWAGELHSGWNARMRAGWGVRAPFSSKKNGRSTRSVNNSPFWFGGRKFLLLSRLPPSGGRGPWWRALSTYLLVTLSWWYPSGDRPYD